jgi:alpha-glucosidase
MKSARLLLIAALMLSQVAFAQTSAVPPAADASAPSHNSTWWKHAVIYEIYPRSFQDSDGDGIGDLNGITQRLDYLKTLGVDAVWISPMYPSPQVDFGYDISNYEAIDPQYGTLKDFDRLLGEAQKRNIRIILDMVLNHTSDKHQWFIDASNSRTNPKHDWYVWSDGKPGTGTNAHEGLNGSVVPPNNWVSLFGGSAWEWVPAVHQFYYHKFYKQQPDLNWRNPQVEKAMFDTMRFWLDRGVAGFRLDAIPSLFEDPQLRDEKALSGINSQGDPNLDDAMTNNLPEVHDVIRRMRAMAASYPGDRVLIGETYLPNTAELDKWYGGTRKDELDLPMDMLLGFSNKLNAPTFRKYIGEAETELHGSQPLFVFDNHDNPRSIDRYGDGVHNQQIAKILASVLLTTPATSLMYYGEELGMTTSTPTRREDVKDPIGITGWPKEKGRDGERTPMQWDASNPQAGFSTDAHTWLPIPPNYVEANVSAESKDPNSLLRWYEQLIRMRRELPALCDGGFAMLDPANPNVLSYLRTAPKGSPSVVVVLNMSGVQQTVSLNLTAEGIKTQSAHTLLTDESSLLATQTLTRLTLPPFTSWIGTIK